jgi:ribosomal protein L37AE/L43A
MKRSIEHLWRRLTDKKVECCRCDSPLGYVVRGGHDRWICEACLASLPPAPAVFEYLRIAVAAPA